MRKKALLQLVAGAGLLMVTAAAQNQSLGDILKGGVKRGGNTADRPAPQQQAPPQPATPQQPRPQEPQQTNPAPGAEARQAAPAGPAAPAAGEGFRMQLPPGWRAELTQNRAVVARSNDASSAVIIAPVMAPQQMTADEYLRRYAAPGLRGWLPNASVANVLPSRLGESGAIASLDFRGVAGPGRGAALLFMNAGLGTLYVIGSPAATFRRDQAALIQILRSFSFEGQQAPGGARAGQGAAATNLSYSRFTDPNEGAFSCEVPSGWKAKGGLLRKSTVDVRAFVQLTSPDGAIHLFAGDPELGTFTLPSETLTWTGFREGSTYSPGYGNVMIVRRYVPGLHFAQEYAARFARSVGASALQVRDLRERPDLGVSQNGLAQETVTAGEISFGCNLGGAEGAGYVLAATKLTTMYGSGLWNVTTLVGYAAPVGQVSVASAAIQRLMQTFQLNPAWFGQQQQTTAQTSAIVTDTNDFVSKAISDSYWSRQRAQDRMSENFSDYIRGRVRLRDPETGEELEGRAGNNYYWRVRGTRTIIGNDHGTPPPTIDVTELEQVG